MDLIALNPIRDSQFLRKTYRNDTPGWPGCFPFDNKVSAKHWEQCINNVTSNGCSISYFSKCSKYIIIRVINPSNGSTHYVPWLTFFWVVEDDRDNLLLLMKGWDVKSLKQLGSYHPLTWRDRMTYNEAFTVDKRCLRRPRLLKRNALGGADCWKQVVLVNCLSFL